MTQEHKPDTDDRRAHSRRLAAWEISWQREQESITGELIDVSEGGLSFRILSSSQPVKCGEQVAVVLTIQEDVPVNCSGVVQHITKGKIGVLFTDLTPEDRSILKRYVESHKSTSRITYREAASLSAMLRSI